MVTGPGPTKNDLWTPKDESLDAGDADVVRVTGPVPGPSTGWRGRAERLLALSSPWGRWWVDRAGAAALAQIAKQPHDVVYTWMQPYESVELGARLARQTGLPWIADFGDPWGLDEMAVYPTALHRAAEKRLMGRLLRHASAIVMSTPEALRRLHDAFPELRRIPSISSPVGYDAADFGAALPPDEAGTERFRIVHTGYLHTADGLRLRRTSRLRRLLGGRLDNVDILTRSHVYLLRAVAAARHAQKTPIEVVLAGVLSNDDMRIAADYDGVTLMGYVPHRETARLMQSADLLFLPMHDLPAGVRAGLVPGKTYEYLASRRPILAAVPEGDARDLLLEAGSAFVCAPSDVEAMAGIICEQIARRERGEPSPRPREDVLARYERSLQAQQLAELFDQVARR